MKPVNWYAFRVRPGTEMRAQALLTGHGVLGRNPVRYVYQRTNAKGEKIVTGKPELSGYFVGEWLDAPNWYAMKSLMYPDGSRVLGRALSVDGVIRPLPGAVRAQIYMLQGFDFNAEPVVEMQHGLKPGDYVIIKGSDPDKVKRIRLERRKRVTDRGQSFVALMDILGSMREVELHEQSLELVEAA